MDIRQVDVCYSDIRGGTHRFRIWFSIAHFDGGHGHAVVIVVARVDAHFSFTPASLP